MKQHYQKKEEFYSRLSNTNVSDDDYYHDIYLKTDVLLLADIFENFRKLCLNYYRLDPVHYFGTPGIAWDACLKMSDEILELIY